MEESGKSIINRIKASKKPSAELIVCGCLSKINKSSLREVYQGPTFGSDEVERANEIFQAKTKAQDIHANFLLPPVHLDEATPYLRKIKRIMRPGILMAIMNRLFLHRFARGIKVYNRHSFCIKVSTGCLSACSFCAVRLSRGTLKSKPINKVVDEFEEGLAKGYTEFALLGTDVGAYGRDQGTSLVALLKELVTRKGDYQIRLRNIQPRFLIEMMPELRNLFQCGKISYLSSAAESGNNRILGLMNRGYRIEDFKEAILTINREFPKIQIRTQLMVGFPSETEEEFQDTVRLLDEVRFDFVEVYTFQPRPNTKAARMKDQIPHKVASRRSHKLLMKSLFNRKERKDKALKEYKKNLQEKTYNLHNNDPETYSYSQPWWR